MRLQKIEYRDKFSLWTFFVDRGHCKHRFPNYAAMRRRDG